jgi:hypothetical protein
LHRSVQQVSTAALLSLCVPTVRPARACLLLALFGYDAVSNFGPQCAQEQTLSRAKPASDWKLASTRSSCPALRIHIFWTLSVFVAATDLGRLSIPSIKNIPFSLDPNHRLIPVHLVPTRGAARDRHERGTGCGGRESADNERHDRVRRSRVVLTPGLLASSPWEANASRGRWWQEAPIHQGEHDIGRKAIAQGRPECFR